MKPGPKPKTWQQFLDFLHTRIKRRGPDECWPFLNKPAKNGTCYASFHQKHLKAARVILGEKLGRPVRDGFDTCHSCDNPICMNPRHLWEGTRADNVTDMVKKGRGRPRRGVTSPHHKLTEEQVLEIRRTYVKSSYGNGMYVLSHKFGVSKIVIFNIIHRNKWKHI